MRKFLLTAALACLFTGGAIAQSEGQRITIERSPGVPVKQEGFVRVQSSVNLFIPGPTGDSEESVRNRDRARRAVYEMAGKDCDVLREVLARDCRLESITTNLNRQTGQGVEGYTVSGQMSLQITLK